MSQEKQLTIHRYPINNPYNVFSCVFISEKEAEEVDETLNETLNRVGVVGLNPLCFNAYASNFYTLWVKEWSLTG